MKTIPFLFCGILLFSCAQKAKEPAPVLVPPGDNYLKDTTYVIDEAADTSTTEFHALIHVLESKGEFRAEEKPGREYEESGTTVHLTRELNGPAANQPIVRIDIKNLFFTAQRMAMKQSLKKFPGFHPEFILTQINFTSEATLKKFTDDIKMGWGDPLKKFNEYYMVFGKKKVYVLKFGVEAFREKTKQYAGIVEAFVKAHGL